MSDLDDRQLRYFVAVAEELHFGRAAERLRMAQPPLSRAIKNMERQLGVRLLERTTRQVTLTAAGQTLLRDARTALDAITAATERARHAGRPAPGLRVALKADYDAGLLPRILDRYREGDAARTVDLILGGRGEQAATLRAGRADVALLPLPFDDHRFDVEPLLTEPRVVALAADDPLAARTSLRLRDLTGRVLPDGSPAEREESRPMGPDSRRLDLAQIFTLIETGSIVLFPPASLAARHPRPGIAYRTVEDLAPSTLAIAWPRDSRSPEVAAFVRAALTAAQDVGQVAADDPVSR